MGANLPPGMSATLTNDSLGLGGFGASAINGGFGVGAAAPPGWRRRTRRRRFWRGPGWRPAGLRRRRFRWWRRRWWRRAGGGGRGGGLGQNANGRGGRAGRGPYNGQFASIGNRRRTTPPVQGSVSITARNSAFNAAPYSLNGQTAQKPYSANNNLNANIGGPLHIPKIVNWQRAQYTISFGTAINRNGRSMVGSVPTLAERSGDFSSLLTAAAPVTIYDPQSGAPFPNNVIPATRFNSASTGLLPYFPNPTYAGIVQNYRFVITDPAGSHNIGVRFNAPLEQQGPPEFQFPEAVAGFELAPAVRLSGYRREFRPEFRRGLEPQLPSALQQQRELLHQPQPQPDVAVLRVHAEYRGGTGNHRDLAGPHQLRTAGNLLHQFFQPERRQSEHRAEPDGHVLG